ncbi:TPA: YodC family protein [Vibrio vulnificus]
MFNIGDIVVLKSGGPVMTVTGRDFADELICTWFDSKQELKSGTFPEASVTLEDDDSF